ERMDPDYWETSYVRLLLGTALAGQRKDAEAAPLLTAGFNGLKARSAAVLQPVRARVLASLRRLVALYEAANRPEEVRGWRNRPDESRTATLPLDPDPPAVCR